MSETLKQTLDRLHQEITELKSDAKLSKKYSVSIISRQDKEIAQLKSDIELSKNKNLNKPIGMPDYIAALNARIDKLNKPTAPTIDIKKEIEKTVTIDYINNIYRNK